VKCWPTGLLVGRCRHAMQVQQNVNGVGQFVHRLTSLSAADEVGHIDLRMWPTARRFKRRHRIRVQVSSGAFPRYAQPGHRASRAPRGPDCSPPTSPSTTTPPARR